MPRIAIQRLEFRVRPEAKSMIERAARLAQQPVGDFVRSAAESRAEQVLREYDVTVVPAEFFDQLLAALDEPAVASPALRRAATRARSVVKR